MLLKTLLRKLFQQEINQLNQDNLTLVQENSNLKNQLRELSVQLDTQKRFTKEYHKKNRRLLKKQGEYKEEITKLNKKLEPVKHKLAKTTLKAVFWEEYSQKVLDRLEYLCFGSNLPKAMRQVDLQHYLEPNKKLLTKWFFDPNGVTIKLKGFENEREQ